MGEDTRKLLHFAYWTFKAARDCPLRYAGFKVAKIDTGSTSKHNAILGIVLQKLLEEYVNGGHLNARVGVEWLNANFNRVWLSCLEKDFVNWKLGKENVEYLEGELQGEDEDLEDYIQRSMSSNDTWYWDIYQETYELVPLFLHTMLKNNVCPTDLKSEFRYKAYIRDLRVWVYGSVDFYSRNEGLIYDGKGTKHKTRFLDPQQLEWYKLGIENCRDEGYPRINRMAWLMIRDSAFNEVESGAVERRSLLSTLNRTANSLRLSMRRIEKHLPAKYHKPGRIEGLSPMDDPRLEHYMAKPSKNTCKYCDFKSLPQPDGSVYECPGYKKMTVNDELFGAV